MSHSLPKAIYLLAFSILFIIPWPGMAQAEGITVGVVLPLSGAQAALGLMEKNSMLLAADEINARKGIHGRPLELDIRDSGGRTGDARALVDHFVKDKHYPVMLGGLVSSVASVLADRCELRRIPLIVTSGSVDTVTMQGSRYVFRVAPPRSRYPAAALDYARSVLRPERVVLITDRSVYGEAMNRECGQVAREAGWDVAGQWQFAEGEWDMERVYSQIGDLKPDVIFLSVFPPEGAKIVAQLREKIPEAFLLDLLPASTMAGSYSRCGNSCEGVMNPSLWWPEGDLSSVRYRDTYLARYGMLPDYHGAEAYASVMAAAQAISRADSVQPESVRDALEGVAVVTPYGKVSFGSREGYTNQNQPPNHLVQWTGKGFELVRPEGR